MNSNTSSNLPAAALISADSAPAAKLRIFEWLTAFGARFEGLDIPDFGDPAQESAAALMGDVIAPLADRSWFAASGPDADTFLQGQLSNDVRELTSSRAQLSSYSNPKGRVLGLFLLIRRPDTIWLETQASVAPALLKRLKMFVMRSKLTLIDAGASAAALGLSGPNAAEILGSAGLPVPEVLWGCADHEGLVVVRRPGAPFPRYSIHGDSAALSALWPKLSMRSRAVGTTTWRLLDLLAGLPAVNAETSEQHVAQMMNLDKLDGISFSKGCYPGQEIVARLHYLGSLKRRLFQGTAKGATIRRGMPVFAVDGSSIQPVGDVLDVAPHPTEGQAVQVVLQLSHREAPLRVGSIEGPTLTLSS